MKDDYVLVQKPNMPLIVGLISFVLTKISLFSQLHRLFDLIFFGAIFTWAWLEIFQGVNYFRKGLGVLVMALLLFTKLT